MQLFEYKTEILNVTTKLPREKQIENFANEKAKEGWRVVSLSVLPQLAYNEGKVGFLLERIQK